MSGEGSVVPVDSPSIFKKVLTKKTSTLRSWLMLDSNGEGTIMDVDKHAIMNKVQLHARDLRILDPTLLYPSTILGREKAIVLNLEHIKAIITAKAVLLQDPLDANVIPIVEELRRRLSPLSSDFQSQIDINEQQNVQYNVKMECPFEFRALEVALEAICSFLDARATELENAAYPALHELTLKISSRNLDRIRKLKTSMTRLTARVQKVRDELEQLIDDDDDMAKLYLSRKLVQASHVGFSSECNLYSPSSIIYSQKFKPSREGVVTIDEDENDVEELEMLLEAYYIQIDNTLNKLSTLREYTDDTEDYINIQLDNHRNQLIKLEFFLSCGNLCLSIHSLVTGIFGMNLKFPWNDNHGYMFKWVIIITSMMCAILYLLIILCASRKGLISS